MAAIQEREAATGRIAPTHGRTGSDTYHCWEAMLSRCCNTRHRSYPQYGAKGVAVCQRWRESFAAFLEDMGERPSRAYSLDRFPDRRGNYEPGNVRWATRMEQARNRATERLLTFAGETLCLTEWATRVGLPKNRIHRRLSRGWSVDRALTEPVRPYPRGAKP